MSPSTGISCISSIISCEFSLVSRTSLLDSVYSKIVLFAKNSTVCQKHFLENFVYSFSFNYYFYFKLCIEFEYNGREFIMNMTASGLEGSPFFQSSDSVVESDVFTENPSAVGRVLSRCKAPKNQRRSLGPGSLKDRLWGSLTSSDLFSSGDLYSESSSSSPSC